jgi:hypothetical protein
LNRSVIRMRAYAVRLLRLRRIEFSVHTGVRGLHNFTTSCAKKAVWKWTANDKEPKLAIGS